MLYNYQAVNKHKKKVSGLVDASNEDSAADIIRGKGLTILAITLEKKGFGLGNIDVLNRVKTKDIVIFSRQFSVLISANVSIVKALKILVDQIKSIKLKIIVSEIADEIDSGSRLSDAFAKRSDVFSNFYISVVRSGETSGKLDDVLIYLADEMEKDYDMMSKIKGAMIYPTIVLAGLTIVGVIMMVVVIPKLTSVFTESGAKLPLPTKILIAISAFMTAYWWLFLLVIIAVIFGIRYLASTPRGRNLLDYSLLKLPIFGKLFQRIHLVRFTRSMNTLILGGVTINESLKISSEVVSNNVYKKLILDTIREVEKGNSISQVFANSKEIPKMVSEMLALGEKTGKLDLVLEKISDFYGREINNIVSNLMTLMEPIIMIVMGVGVGLMVAAIILPMYNMASQF